MSTSPKVGLKVIHKVVVVSKMFVKCRPFEVIGSHTSVPSAFRVKSRRQRRRREEENQIKVDKLEMKIFAYLLT